MRAAINLKSARFFHRFWSSETVILFSFAVLVGIGTGLGTIVFIRMIGFFNQLFFGKGNLLGLPGHLYVILLPVVGGLIVGPLVHFVAPEAKGHGVPEVLTAVATKGGRIRPIVVLVKALGSAITIGSGGSVGREGPIVQIGAALGSTIGQFAKFKERRIINLVASGAAAGIAATFNAPIAGVMFAVEVILGDLGIRTLSTMVVSAVTASVVSRAVLGDAPAFTVPVYSMKSAWELPLYLGLGLIAGFGAIGFVKSLYYMESLFDSWKFPAYLKPAIGGLGLGVLGYFLPQVFGTGFSTIGDVLTGKLGLLVLILLVFGKILATTLTLGSGASGGVFAPALFTGAVLGGAYGQVLQILFPGQTASSGAYAMVGMAAVFAGAARAPITAILILFEMTQDYRIILPLMLATIVSMLLANRMEPESIYTLKLKLRGIVVTGGKQENVLGSVEVKDMMTPVSETITVPKDTPLPALAQLFQESGHHGFAVIDERGDLVGVVTLSDMTRAFKDGLAEPSAGQICTRHIRTVYPDDTLDDALHLFGVLDVGRVPVIERNSPHHLVGILRRGDIVHALSKALEETHQRLSQVNRKKLQSFVSTELSEFVIRPESPVSGKHLAEINLPPDCVIISIQRGRNIVVPRGSTALQPGDRVLAYAGNGSTNEMRAAFAIGDKNPSAEGPK
jgi:chloride channel protein, CIC family